MSALTYITYLTAFLIIFLGWILRSAVTSQRTGLFLRLSIPSAKFSVKVATLDTPASELHHISNYQFKNLCTFER